MHGFIASPSAPSVVPEPATMLLLGSGFGETLGIQEEVEEVNRYSSAKIQRQGQNSSAFFYACFYP